MHPFPASLVAYEWWQTHDTVPVAITFLLDAHTYASTCTRHTPVPVDIVSTTPVGKVRPFS